MYPF
jgi:hypothetical protein